MKIYNTEISGIEIDSRKVKEGFLFVDTCNNQYIESAIKNGAKVILSKEEFADKAKYPEIIFITNPEPAWEFAKIAARFYPEQPENICAITGTNGKTSIADFIRQMLNMMGENAASMGTLGLIKNDETPIASNNTTPNAIVVHQELNQLAKEGFKYVAIEMSSHGLEQRRVGAVKVKVAGFTNLTQDHLDYHKNMQNYLEAKKILFRDNLLEGGIAVLNADIEVFDELKTLCLEGKKKVISYGHKGDEIKLIQAISKNNGQVLDIDFLGKRMEIFIPLAGEFQAMNVLCALGMLFAITGKKEIAPLAEKLKGAKGRLEFVGQTKNGAAVYVDYAHTPDALENVIKSMRSHTKGNLSVVFGCGGDRDATKRPIMGKIAQDLADAVYVADDNPRTEDATKIREQIMIACPKGHNIGDREEAIKTAIRNLQPEDILIVAGKGHETGQYVNGKILPFSDHEVIAKYL